MTSKVGYVLTILVIFLVLFEISESAVPMYQYKRYTYRKKQKHEKKIKGLQQNCESRCGSGYSLRELECTRRCVSEFCYMELYGEDPLEEGEIDVRYTSFKGCVLKEIPKMEQTRV